MRSRSQRVAAPLLFLATIAAALPVARFCPLGWDEIDLAAYATCSAMPAGSGCVAPATTPTKDTPAGCGAMATCPMRARRASGEARCGSCPAASCGSHSVQRPAGGSSGPPPVHHAGPGWCFAEPLIAAAARAHAPPPPTPLAIAVAIVTIEVPATVRPVEPAADARPPNPPSPAPPPIRGPPSLLG